MSMWSAYGDGDPGRPVGELDENATPSLAPAGKAGVDLQSLGDKAMTSRNACPPDNFRAYSVRTADLNRPQPDIPASTVYEKERQVVYPERSPQQGTGVHTAPRQAHFVFGTDTSLTTEQL
jgi:hypothetical protein